MNIFQKSIAYLFPLKNEKRGWDKLRGNLKNINKNNVDKNSVNNNDISNIPADEEEFQEIFYYEQSLPKNKLIQNSIVPKKTSNSVNNGSDNFSRFIRERKRIE